MHPADTVGARIRYWRLRRGGMTQQVLAGLAGLTQSYISQVESGRRTVDRRSTLAAIAAALRVTPADLLGQPDPTDPALTGGGEAVPAIWTALIEIEEGERRTPTRCRDALAAAIDQADDLRSVADHQRLAVMLPGLLADAAAYGGQPLIRAAYLTSTCLRHLGYRHLAVTAARVAVHAAEESEHPAWIGAARMGYTLALPIEAAGVASRHAARALADLQAHAADRDVRQMLGQLHLGAAFASAVDGRPDDAEAHLVEAAREAESLGDPVDGYGFHRCGFGPTNVLLWRMAIAAELGEYGRVVELSRSVRPDPLRAANRHQAYWLDLGRALAHTRGGDREALAALVRAERAAPALFAVQPIARETVMAMVRRAQRRAVGPDLRVLARRVGLDV